MMKDQHPEIAWKQVANFGNHLRHAYHKVDLEVLWDTYLDDLEPLSAAVEALIAKFDENQP